MKNLPYLVVLVLFTYTATYFVGYSQGYEKGKRAPAPVQMVTGDIKAETKTVIRYVYKTPENANDMVANVHKPEFTVQVNGKTTTFNKTQDEAYLFEKNQLVLDQTSKVNFAVSVTPVDLTKRYGFGLGFDRDGVNAQVSFPALGAIDATVQASTTRLGAGFLIRF